VKKLADVRKEGNLYFGGTKKMQLEKFFDLKN
jgi:hypothetical protein